MHGIPPTLNSVRWMRLSGCLRGDFEDMLVLFAEEGGLVNTDLGSVVFFFSLRPYRVVDFRVLIEVEGKNDGR